MRQLLVFISMLFAFAKTNLCFSQELPIKPSRTASFTTDEGSEMNVDVSPDGKALVFDLLGDLYTIPVTGGKATQLTQGIAVNTAPAWSHDGRLIAYISDISGTPHINVRDISGSFHRVLENVTNQANRSVSYPIWSGDDKVMALNIGITGKSNCLLYNIIDDSKTSLPDSVGWPEGSSADGKFWYDFYDGKMFRYETVKSENTVLPFLKSLLACTSSLDGKWLVYLTKVNAKTCLVAMNLKKNTESTLARFPLFSVLTHHLSFAPDSKNIYLGYGGKIHRINIEDGTDNIVPFSCNVKVGLGPLDYNTFRVSLGSTEAKYIRSISKSPDGKHLVFSALNRIYVKDLPVGKPRMLCLQPYNQYQPCWSPDGKWIAYVTWCDTAGGGLWKVRVTGGTPIRVAKAAGEYQRPVWLPDSKAIAVVKGGPAFGIDASQMKLNAFGKGVSALGFRGDPGIGQLQLVSLRDGQVRALADSIPLWNQIAFSSDGTKIIYEPKVVRNNRNSVVPLLVSKELNGDNTKTLVEYYSRSFPVVSPSWILQRSISPDGRYIVFSAGEDICLLPVAEHTGPAYIYNDNKKLPVIRFAKGIDPKWEYDGKTLCWTYADKFYEIDPAEVVAAAAKTPREKNDFGLVAEGWSKATVSPDRTVPVSITVPRYFSHGTIALKNTRIITMHGDKVIEKGVILIKDGRFAGVGDAGQVLIPKGAKVIDLSGKTIIPGFVDLHLHMYVPPDVFPQQSWMYLVNLAYGVTTARDPSSSYDSYGYAELLRSGQMIGPRLFSSGMPVRTELSEGMALNDLSDFLNTVQKRKLLGGTFMKQYDLPTPIQRQWLLIASRKEGLNMTNEGGTNGWLAVLRMIKDGSSGIEHMFLEDVYKDVTTFIAKSGTYFTPTLQVTPEPGAKAYFNYKYWHSDQKKLERFNHLQTGETENGAEGYGWITREKPGDTTDARFIHADSIVANIRKQGGLVTLGSHGNDEGIGVHNEIWALKMGGISNIQALQAATIMGAGALGIQKDVGSIEAGKVADLVILNSNPLDDIHNTRDIKYVMKGGILYDGDTLDELWPVKKKCPDWQLHK